MADSHPAFRVVSVGHLSFAAAMIWLGVMGLRRGDFVQVWQPVPSWVPAREALAYLCALISLTCGIGLLLGRTAALAARVEFASLMLWLLAFRVPNLFFQTPLVLVAWTFGSTAVMVAATWVLYVRFAGDRDRQRLGRLAGEVGVRIARALYGVSLVPFGLAHFQYLDATTTLIPQWLPWHVAWAYLTGACFVAAGLAVMVGVFARLAAVLSAVQLGLFGLIVWVPRVLSGSLNEFQWGEFVMTFVLTAGAGVVAESYPVEGAEYRQWHGPLRDWSAPESCRGHGSRRSRPSPRPGPKCRAQARRGTWPGRSTKVEKT